ncbi:MAG: hypothetical protein USCAAHI_01539 [Beijerinckiaceae bacterium]|nr:MAG: hypothetical protein USCAAHI_01539 [Beijerinckiaceae bacterium]
MLYKMLLAAIALGLWATFIRPARAQSGCECANELDDLGQRSSSLKSALETGLINIDSDVRNIGRRRFGLRPMGTQSEAPTLRAAVKRKPRLFHARPAACEIKPGDLRGLFKLAPKRCDAMMAAPDQSADRAIRPACVFTQGIPNPSPEIFHLGGRHPRRLPQRRIFVQPHIG